MKYNVDCITSATFGLVWCAVTFAGDGFLAWSVVQQWWCNDYSQTTGTVTHSQAEYSDSSISGSSWQANVRYSYVVDGRQYKSSRLRYDVHRADERSVRATVARYPPQSAVTVYYDPANPSDAVLERNIEFTALLGVGLLLTPFNAIALGFAGANLKELRFRFSSLPVRATVHRSGTQTTIRFTEIGPGLVMVIAVAAASFVALVMAAILNWLELLPEFVNYTVAWCLMLVLTVIAWQRAPRKYIALRRDSLLGIAQIRRWDGTHTLLAGSRLELIWPNRPNKKNQQGPILPVHLRFIDSDERRRKLSLPESATKEEAEKITEWLNRSLELTESDAVIKK